MYNILVLDDDKFILASLQRLLRNNKSWHVDIYNDPFAALEHAHNEHYDLFLSDYQMMGMDGIEFLAQIKSLQPASGRIILSGDCSNELLEKATRDAGVYCVVSKPVQPAELISTINLALNNCQKQHD